MRTRSRILAAVGAVSFVAAAVAATTAAVASTSHSGGPAVAPSAVSLTSIQPGGLPRRVGAQAASSQAMASALVNGKVIRTSADNWAGYVAHQGKMKFRLVSARFRVPKLICRGVRPAHPTYSSHWVGLDGFSTSATNPNNTVEQDGVLAACLRNSNNRIVPVYAAWWEMFPKAPVYPKIKVHPGDSILAIARYSPSTHKFTLKVSDTTDRRHFTHVTKCLTTCKRTSAEVISEAPATVNGSKINVLPLADFQKARFNKIDVVNGIGHRGGIVSTKWNAYRITQRSDGSNLNWRGATIPKGTVLDRVTALFKARSFGTQWTSANR